MKQYQTCQRTYAEDHLVFCLDDGSPLLNATPDPNDSPPTMRIPEPRVTHQTYPLPTPASQPVVSPGFKFNNRGIGIIGASLLILGIFMPLLIFLGIISISYLQLAQMSATFSTGYILPVLGIASLILALKSRYKLLIGIGILALAILVIDFFRIRSAIASGLPMQIPGGGSGMDSAAVGNALQSVIQISWGFFAMVAGAILLIVAGAKKDKSSMNGPDWNRNPPPPMNYT